MRFLKSGKRLLVILGIIFIVYNVVLFALCGFNDHGVAFWISWAFMMVAFATLALSVGFIGKRVMILRDWLFGYPLIKHSFIYIIFELVLSTLFIVLDGLMLVKWVIAFSLQFIALGVYLVFAVSCLIAKEAIDNVNTKVKDKKTFIRLLKVDADILVDACNDPDAKKKFSDFAEMVRYSDPMSSEALFELEKEISYCITLANEKIKQNSKDEALELCQKASLLLTERNKKTKALK